MSDYKIDPGSDTWRCIQQYAATRMAALRDTIDSPNTTDALRRDSVMRLDEVRALLSQEHPPKPMPATTPVTY